MSDNSSPRPAAKADQPPRIPLSVPNVGPLEGKYLAECVETNWVSTAGPAVSKFEKMLSDEFGGAHVVAVSSGSAALHLAMILAGIGADDEVIVPAITFMATCSTVRCVGAWPAIVDVDARNWQIDPDAVARFLSEACDRRNDGRVVNRKTGRTVRGIAPVHVLGHPCDLDRLSEIAARYGLTIIEDAAEAIGTRYKGRPVGTDGLIGCLSFNGNKIITTGGGGALITRNPKIHERGRYLSTHAKDDAIRYVHKEIGFNYRLTNLSAAMGCAQLERLDGFLIRKKEVAALYRKLLGGIPGIGFMEEANWATSSWWLFTVRIEPAAFGCDREALMARLSQRGIETRPLWQPMHRSEALAGSYSHDIRVADTLYAEALSLPCSTNISDADVERVCNSIREIHRQERS